MKAQVAVLLGGLLFGIAVSLLQAFIVILALGVVAPGLLPAFTLALLVSVAALLGVAKHTFSG